MLKKVREEDAIPVAEMLRRRMKYFEAVADRINEADVPAAVRQVLREAVKKSNSPE